MEKEANNLDALANRIYEEGVAKANTEAEKLVAKAQQERERILAAAQKEAQKIAEDAEKKAQQLLRNAQSELKLNARQLMGELKQQIVHLLKKELIDRPVGEGFTDKAYLQELALAMAKAWQPQEQAKLELSEEMQQHFDERAINSITQALDGMEVSIGPAHGSPAFKILKQDEGFHIVFDQEAFETFFGSYLEENIRKAIFTDRG